MHVSFRCWCVAHTLLLVPCVHLKIAINVTVTSQLNRSSQFTTKFINRLHFIIVMCLHIKKMHTTCTPTAYCTIVHVCVVVLQFFIVCYIYLSLKSKYCPSSHFAYMHKHIQQTKWLDNTPTKKQNAKKATQPLKKMQFSWLSIQTNNME